jgi:hypothetical protein
LIGFISYPGHVSIRPDQDGNGRSYRADYGKLPRIKIFGIKIFDVDELDPISPLRDIDVAGLTEIEQHGPGMVE